MDTMNGPNHALPRPQRDRHGRLAFASSSSSLAMCRLSISRASRLSVPSRADRRKPRALVAASRRAVFMSSAVSAGVVGREFP